MTITPIQILDEFLFLFIVSKPASIRGIVEILRVTSNPIEFRKLIIIHYNNLISGEIVAVLRTYREHPHISYLDYETLFTKYNMSDSSIPIKRPYT